MTAGRPTERRRALGRRRPIAVRVAVFAAAVFAVIAVIASVIGIRMLRSELIGELDRGNVNRITELTLQTELRTDEPFVAVEDPSTTAAILDADGFLVSATDDLDPAELLDIYLAHDDGEPFDVSFDVSTIVGGDSMRGVVLTALPGAFDDALDSALDDELDGGFDDELDSGSGDGLDGGFDDELDDDFGDEVGEVSADTFAIFLATSTDSLDRTVSFATRAVAVAVPLLTLVVGLLVYAMVRRSLRSVERLRREVASFDGEALDRRLPHPEVDDELGRLAITMNGMLDRIERSAERQRRFAADASHELRSPLASMSAQLDVDLAHPDHADWPTTARTLRAETTRMQQLVDDLLTLARAGAAETGPTGGAVALDDLAVDATATTPPRDGVAVELGTLERVDARADETAVRRIVDNLLANAVRHASSRVIVTVEAVSQTTPTSDDHPTVAVIVDDDGPGVAATDRERVFERFIRLDHARSRDAGGSGLGLAICRELAEALGGAIELGDAPIGGARFALALPAH